VKLDFITLFNNMDIGLVMKSIFSIIILLICLVFYGCKQNDSVNEVRKLITTNGIPYSIDEQKVRTFTNQNVLWCTLKLLQITRLDKNTIHKIAKVEIATIRVENFKIDTLTFEALLDLDDINNLLSTIEKISKNKLEQSSNYKISFQTKDGFGFGVHKRQNESTSWAYIIANYDKQLYLFKEFNEWKDFYKSLLICKEYILK